jgi:hypothetical protein
MKIKQKIYNLVLILFCLELNSCTFPKGDCIEASAEMIHSIIFYNFTQQDLDSTILISCNPASKFTHHIDSLLIHVYLYDTLKLYAVSETPMINIDLDYKINVVRAGQIFELNHFTTRRVKCGKGLFNTDYFNELNSYLINGEKKSGNFIEIYKQD